MVEPLCNDVVDASGVCDAGIYVVTVGCAVDDDGIDGDVEFGIRGDFDDSWHWCNRLGVGIVLPLCVLDLVTSSSLSITFVTDGTVCC